LVAGEEVKAQWLKAFLMGVPDDTDIFVQCGPVIFDIEIASPPGEVVVFKTKVKGAINEKDTSAGSVGAFVDRVC